MRIAFVDGGTYYHHATYNDPELKVFFDRNIYVLDLPEADLSDVDCLYIASRQNPADLVVARDVIDAFLASGKMVVALGESHCEQWLSNVDWMPGVTNFWWWLTPGEDSGLRLNEPDHGLFSYITLDDATWHRHGTLSVPPGAKSLINAIEGGSVLYDDSSSSGRRIVSTLDPCYHHGSYFMPATTGFLKGFLPWLKQGAPASM
ncbi:hypothetical protein [Oceanospirillum maris]|jgi:hypothetical protein|uniref:hypothetical protein n=1 Tax=Oceanospirillum maris TaxID=64977 RepID=UPI0004889932|nr:hypothetical protein [Oceanospirillum maris]